MNQRIFLISGIFCILFTAAITQQAQAWGERGHHTSGYVAAVIADEHLTAEEKTLMGYAFRERTHQMGHLNNIPDISWKDSRRKTVVKFNGPNHYFDAEILLGVPTNSKGEPTLDISEEYLQKIRNLEKDFVKLRAQYEGQPNPLPGAANTDRSKIDLYKGVGTAPWRVQGLYETMVEAFQCAKGKPKLDPKTAKAFASPLKPAENKPIYPYYKCTQTTTRLEDLYAAFAFAGVMGHYVADISQPFHTTMDFDGWVTGQGGIHAYFESYMLHFLPESFTGEVTSTAKEIREKTWKRLGAPAGSAHFATQTLLNLTADSFADAQTLRKIDRKVSLIEEGEKVLLGALPAKVKAKRKPFTDEKILKAYKEFARNRLAISSVVLSGLWMQAWRDGGKPEIADVDLETTPYILDVPFLWPSYSKYYLK